MPKTEPAAIDISKHLEALCNDLCTKVPELAHIDPDRLLFCLTRSRAQGTHGVYARIVPLRFAGGQKERKVRRGRYLETYRLPSITHRKRKILYLIHVFVPRFLRLPRREKLLTVMHEMYHVSQRCDGDIRRFPGRNYAHGPSRKWYDAQVAQLAEGYLEKSAPGLLDFLDITEEDWQRGDIRISGWQVPLPKARLVARTKS